MLDEKFGLPFHKLLFYGSTYFWNIIHVFKEKAMWQKDTIAESFVHAMFEMKSHYRFTFWYGSSYDKNNNLKAIIKTYCDK